LAPLTALSARICVIGFFVMPAVLSWYPQPEHEAPMRPPKAIIAPATCGD
jgi:hypothetical protein